MVLGGPLRDHQLGGDLPVAAAPGDQVGDLQFPGRQRCRLGCGRCQRLLLRLFRRLLQCAGEDILGGQVAADGKEVSDLRFFGFSEIPRDEVMENHLEIIRDSVFWSNKNVGMRALGRRLAPRIK